MAMACSLTPSSSLERPTLPHTVDSYSSVAVKPIPDGISENEFKRQLSQSCDVWRQQGHKGVFLELMLRQASLIPIAVGMGFKFHLTRYTTKLILSLWLPKDIPNNLPSGPSHFLGVAALVVRKIDQRILVVQEKTGPAAKYKFWKLPGGQANARESIEKAAVREILEETGIQTSFRALASILHLKSNKSNLVRAGYSDIFCTCILDTKDPNPPLVLQENEIEDAKWVGVDDLLKLDVYCMKDTAFRRSVEAAVVIVKQRVSDHSAKKVNSESRGLSSESLPLGFRKGIVSVLRAKL